MTKEKFKEVWDTYYIRGYCLINKIVKDPEASFDLTQDAFIDIWKHYKDMGKDQSFIFHVCANKAKDFLRSKFRSIDLEICDDLATYPSDNDLVSVFTLSSIYEGIDHLPPQCRKIINLFLKGLNFSQIGTVLNISRQVAWKQYSIGVKKLRSQIH